MDGEFLSEGTIICEKYKIIVLIGKGAFGAIQRAENIDNKQHVAVKIENNISGRVNSLQKEVNFLIELAGKHGFPQVQAYEKSITQISMVCTLLGPNLGRICRKLGKKQSLPQVLVIGNQLIDRLEKLHSQGIIHRDLKPENLCIGLGKHSETIQLIDFGLSKKYLTEEGKHIPFNDKRGLVGTPRQTSINSHCGFEQSRRDDLEALGQILVHFAVGSLPWMHIECDTAKERDNQIKNMKMQIKLEDLCKGLPQEFVKQFEYAKKLTFFEKPNQSQLKRLFRICQFKLSKKCDITSVNSLSPKKKGSIESKKEEESNQSPKKEESAHQQTINGKKEFGGNWQKKNEKDFRVEQNNEFNIPKTNVFRSKTTPQIEDQNEIRNKLIEKKRLKVQYKKSKTKLLKKTTNSNSIIADFSKQLKISMSDLNFMQVLQFYNLVYQIAGMKSRENTLTTNVSLGESKLSKIGCSKGGGTCKQSMKTGVQLIETPRKDTGTEEIKIENQAKQAESQEVSAAHNVSTEAHHIVPIPNKFNTLLNVKKRFRPIKNHK